MPVPWNSDDPRDLPVIEANLRSVLTAIVEGSPVRVLPPIAIAQQWHRLVLHQVRLPVQYYAGEFRGSDPAVYPGLSEYEVVVGQTRGVPAAEVSDELCWFEISVRRAVEALDQLVPIGTAPEGSDTLHSVLTLCASTHGEWIRIHPFANGNGRVARLWANWCALRYGLPPFIRLLPRPAGSSYAAAAASSMLGDHRAMVAVFADSLIRRLQTE